MCVLQCFVPTTDLTEDTNKLTISTSREIKITFSKLAESFEQDRLHRFVQTEKLISKCLNEEE